MIAKHTLGQGFRGVLAYLLREGMPERQGEAVLLGGNLSGATARTLAREFGVFRRLNGKVRRPVFHASLRLPAGERLSDAQWRQAAASYLTRMGYTDTAYVVVRHPENHIHIVASRVRFDGSRVLAWKDRWRSLKAVADLERQFGLSHPSVRPGLSRHQAPVRFGRAEHALRSPCNADLPRQLLADRLDEAIARSDGTRAAFTQVLAELDVAVRWNIGGMGRVLGGTFTLADYTGPLQATMKGSAIGPAFAWQQLAARLAAREREHLDELSRASKPKVARRTMPVPTTRQAGGGALAGGSHRGWRQQPLPATPGASQPTGQRRLPDNPPGVLRVPARLIREARTSLDQQRRWNGHPGEDAVVRLTASHLVRLYPEVTVSSVLAAIEAARPGSLAAYPGGAAELAAQLGAAISSRAQEYTLEEREYGTR